MIIVSSMLAPVLVGAVLNLDRQVCGPFMIGRPLVVGFVIGLMTGEWRYGAWLGLSVELLWLAILPLGGEITPNSGLAVSAALIAWVNSGFAPAVGSYLIETGLVAAFLTVPLWAWLFTFLDRFNRILADRRLALVRDDLAVGRDPQFFSRNLQGLWLTLAGNLAALTLAVFINGLIFRLAICLLPDQVLTALGFLYEIIPLLGLIGMGGAIGAKSPVIYISGLVASLLALSAVL